MTAIDWGLFLVGILVGLSIGELITFCWLWPIMLKIFK